MLIAYLSGSGSRVEIPDAVDCVDCDDETHVAFVDNDGRVLVRFQRVDISMFTTAHQAELLAGPLVFA